MFLFLVLKKHHLPKAELFSQLFPMDVLEKESCTALQLELVGPRKVHREAAMPGPLDFNYNQTSGSLIFPGGAFCQWWMMLLTAGTEFS